MGISTINLALGASYGAYSKKLTQATKNQLEALGIPYDRNITEEEGKRLIKAHEAQKQENSNNNLFQNNQGTNDLFEKAKKLAEKLGIQVEENANFQHLLMIIQQKIEEKLQTNSNNIEAIKELKGLSQELAFIQAQSNGSSGYDNTNQALMTSLEMLSQYNKNLIHRN